MRSQNTIGMLWAVWLTLASSLAVSPTADAAFDCMDEGNLCLESEGTWQSERRSNSKDRKRRSKKTAGTLTIRIEGGRGSVFINGRYAGTAPLEGIDIPSGKNDLQIRDGADVLATGLLTVPKQADIIAVVRHP